MDQIMSACHWRSNNTFTQFYLKDLSGEDQNDHNFHLGSFVAAQQVVLPQWRISQTLKNKGGARDVDHSDGDRLPQTALGITITHKKVIIILILLLFNYL